MNETYWHPKTKIKKYEFTGEIEYVVETKWTKPKQPLSKYVFAKHRPIELLLIHSQLECSNDAIQDYYLKNSSRGFNDWEYFLENEN